MKKLVAAVVAGTGLVVCTGQAQSTNEVAELPSVTVYASRIDDAKESIPAAISVFTAEDIEASGVRDLPELLKKKAGIDVHSMNGNPLLTSIAMRGFGDNAFGRTKIVLDGEELNNVDMNVPNLTRIPLGSVERIEIIRGPSPVLYGDGAIAGVVNVISNVSLVPEFGVLGAAMAKICSESGIFLFLLTRVTPAMRRQFCKVALVRFAGRLIIMILWSMPTFQEQTRPFVTQSG